MADLTVKQKEFCRLMATGKCANQSHAYKQAFKPPTAKASTIREKASRLMAKGNIQAMITELSKPVDQKIRKTREDYLDLLEGATYHDAGKMFDDFGNPLEVNAMPFAERMSIAGFEFVEDFTKVKKANGSEDAVPTGFTKKFKIIDRHKFAVTYGKMMGFISDDPPPVDASMESLTVVFVNSKGVPVDVNFNPQTRQISRVDVEEKPRQTPGVTFVSHRT